MQNNQELPNKDQSPQMFNRISGTYDLLNRALSGGIDIYWRNLLIDQLPDQKHIKALDLATGTADLAIALAKNEKVSEVIGVDPSTGMLDVGRKKIKKQNLEDIITLSEGDALDLKFEDNTFDIVTISFGIRNFPCAQKGLQEIYRVLKPNGKLLILEFGVPQNILKAPYLFYFRKVLPQLGALVSKDKTAYTYLNQTVEQFPYGNDFGQLMKKNHFVATKNTGLTFGICYLYQGHKGI